jgi:hypothetical protein
MESQLFSIKYPDKHAAALIFLKIKEAGDALGVTSCGMEKLRTRSNRVRSQLRIIVAVRKQVAQDLPGQLKIVQNSLKNHRLYPHLSFDFCITPISQTKWSFDSYDDPNYQDILIRKRS